MTDAPTPTTRKPIQQRVCNLQRPGKRPIFEMKITCTYIHGLQGRAPKSDGALLCSCREGSGSCRTCDVLFALSCAVLCCPAGSSHLLRITYIEFLAV